MSFGSFHHSHIRFITVTHFSTFILFLIFFFQATQKLENTIYIISAVESLGERIHRRKVGEKKSSYSKNKTTYMMTSFKMKLIIIAIWQ